MTILITQRTTTTPGPDLAIDCPRCQAKDVIGRTYDVEERNRLFWVIPFFTGRWVTVQCGACGHSFGSDRSPDELAARSQSDLSVMLANWQETNVDFLVKFCVVIGLVLGLFPFVGLIFALIGVLCTFRRKTVWRTLAWIGLAMSLISTIGVSLLLMFAK